MPEDTYPRFVASSRMGYKLHKTFGRYVIGILSLDSFQEGMLSHLVVNPMNRKSLEAIYHSWEGSVDPASCIGCNAGRQNIRLLSFHYPEKEIVHNTFLQGIAIDGSTCYNQIVIIVWVIIP